MKTIMFVTGSMSRGGAERVISILSDYYSRKGWKVEILMILHNKIEYELHPNVKVVNVSKERSKIIDLLPLIRRVRKYVNKVSPDVIVGFMAQISLVLGFACKKQLSKIVTSERIDPSKVHRNFIYRFFLNRAYSGCKNVVLQTERAKNYFPPAVRKNSVIIENPIRVQCYANENKSHRIVTAGRLTEQKNHKMLINAFEKIHMKYPEYKLDIFGEGPLKNELQALIESKGLENSIALAGGASDLHNQISDAEFFVLSSDYEGLSNALLEAMMMGLPCISTDCSGSDEAIQNGENGLLVPIGDTDKLAEAMLSLIENEALRIKLAKAAMQTSDKYKVDNIIQKWTEVIEGEK